MTGGVDLQLARLVEPVGGEPEKARLCVLVLQRLQTAPAGEQVALFGEAIALLDDLADLGDESAIPVLEQIAQLAPPEAVVAARAARAMRLENAGGFHG